MKNLLGGSRKENMIALAVGGLGCLLLALSWLNGARAITAAQWALAVVLAGSLILIDLYPIHIRYAVKISLISVPLFLIMALLPLPLALVAAGTAILGANYFTRSSRGLLGLDYIQDPGRWMVIVFAGSTIAHLDTWLPIDENLLLIAGAAAMFILDVATFSLLTSFNIHESFVSLMREGLAQVFEIETIQYLVGILGAMVFYQAAWALLLLIVPIIIFYKTFKNAKEMNQSTREMLVNMADTIDMRDTYTGGHSQRVAELSSLILRQLGITGTEFDLINTAARLHDIGKIGVPDAVLLKPGPLTPQEWDMMRTHPQKSAELLGRYPDFVRGRDMVKYHHEREDGTGYPSGLKGSDIPFGARVIAVADAYDAMTTDRPYRSGKSLAEARQILKDGRGSQWDQKVVDALLAVLKEE
jgi:hypothetical protein